MWLNQYLNFGYFVLTRSCYVVCAGLKLTILFLPLPHWWVNKHAPTCPVHLVLLTSTTRLTSCKMASTDEATDGRDLF